LMETELFTRTEVKVGNRGIESYLKPALNAIRASLTAYGKELATMPPEESLWPSISHHSKGITSGTFYGNLQRYFRKAGITPAGVHIFRHTAAKLRRDAGETIEDVSRFLDHSSLAVTTVYLRRLEGEQDRSWAKSRGGDWSVALSWKIPVFQLRTSNDCFTW